MKDRLGFSGRIARQFQDNELTPLLALTALMLGLFAIMVTPREEEPQIDVTFANVFVAFPGASSIEVIFFECLIIKKYERRTSNVEFLIRYSADLKIGRAKRFHHSMFNVRCWMFKNGKTF